MELINKVFENELGKIVIASLDNLLPHSKMLHDHLLHIYCVHRKRKKEWPFVMLSKSNFAVSEKENFGLMSLHDGISVSLQNI